MSRDREATRARILGAVERIVASEGVSAVGVNAVAAAAGVDKVLLYRYFGGREGMLRALASERRLWPATLVRDPASTGLGAELRDALLECARTLRAQPLARRAAAWSLESGDEFARDAASARDEELRLLIGALRERHVVPRYLDLDSAVALLSAALSHLAIQSASGAGGDYAGLDLRSDDDWRRVEKMVSAIVNSLTSASEV